MVGADAALVLLGLIAADSIYHEPIWLRIVLLAVAAIALATALVRVRAGTVGFDRGRLIHRGILCALLLAFFLGSVAVRPGYCRWELARILAPWHDGRSAAEILAAQQQQQREQEQQKIMDRLDERAAHDSP
jgi:hypothetical protein